MSTTTNGSAPEDAHEALLDLIDEQETDGPCSWSTTSRPTSQPRRAWSGPSTASASPSSGARRSASSASRARARPSCPARSWACSRPQRRSARAASATTARSSSAPAPSQLRRAVGHRDGDGVPGPDDLAQPGDEDRHARSPRRCATTSTCPRTRPTSTAVAAAATRSASPSPSAGSTQYPHELSGGMRQRVDDRHRPGLRPQAALRRRAHHRPRRHRAGPDPRPAQPSSSASGTWR